MAMDYAEIDGRLYEFTLIALSSGDEIMVECMDMTPQGGGLLGWMMVPRNGTKSLTLIQKDIPLEVIQAWITFAEQS